MKKIANCPALARQAGGNLQGGDDYLGILS